MLTKQQAKNGRKTKKAQEDIDIEEEFLIDDIDDEMQEDSEETDESDWELALLPVTISIL